MTIPDPQTIEPLDEAIARTPDAPAVFLIWPREGAPYLARTGLLWRRLKRLLKPREAPGRLLNLREVAARIDYWPTASRLESSLIMYALATRHFPETYMKLLKLRLPPYLKVLTANPFPRTQVTTRLGGSGVSFGPFRARGAAELFESQALDLFQVRRCQEDLLPSADHPGCIYGEMNMCLRPCQLMVSREEYRSEADRLVEFLETEGRSLTEPLQAARERLSEEMQFEEAARQHRQLEKIQQVLRSRDELVRDVDRLYGVAVTASVAPGAVELWFVVRGCWAPPVRFGFEVVEGRTVSLDHRLREIVSGLAPARITVQERQEHLALLARWFYSEWRDGDWIPFDDLERVPYRKLVRAISRAPMLKPHHSPTASG
jgi:excinuclease UvrABC nuclease subunit